jgi:hypothetical protein
MPNHSGVIRLKFYKKKSVFVSPYNWIDSAKFRAHRCLTIITGYLIKFTLFTVNFDWVSSGTSTFQKNFEIGILLTIFVTGASQVPQFVWKFYDFYGKFAEKSTLMIKKEGSSKSHILPF